MDGLEGGQLGIHAMDIEGCETMDGSRLALDVLGACPPEGSSGWPELACKVPCDSGLGFHRTASMDHCGAHHTTCPRVPHAPSRRAPCYGLPHPWTDVRIIQPGLA